MQAWDYPANTFDVVIDIFTQFSSPEERAKNWRGVHQTLNPGGLMVVQGYTPRQLRAEERDMHEGAAHSGMSAVIGLTAHKSP